MSDIFTLFNNLLELMSYVDGVSNVVQLIRENILYLIIGTLTLIYFKDKEKGFDRSDCLRQKRQQAKEELLHSTYSWIDAGTFLVHPTLKQYLEHSQLKICTPC